MPSGLGSFLDRRTPAQHDHVRERDLLAAGLRAVEVILNLLQRLQHLRQFGRIVDFPILLRREANARSVRPTALVGPAERRRRSPCSRDPLGNGKSRGENLALEIRDVLLANQLMIDLGNGVLPQLRLGHQRAEAPRDRPHVAVGQLVPRLGKGVGKRFRVFVEAF